LLLGLLQLCIESLRFFLARLFYLLPSLRLDLLDRVNRGLTEPCKINAAILSEPYDRLLWIAVTDFICETSNLSKIAGGDPGENAGRRLHSQERACAAATNRYP
jgi:hypothetical protein